MEEDLVGRTVLGRYRIVMPLGRGGQGMVYLARGEGAAGFARPVVVKRVLAPYAADQQVLDGFAREARITSQLRHPDIVSVIDFERDGVSYVMVLEYVHGYDMRRWERFVIKQRQKFEVDLVAYAMVRVLEALHYAHTLRAPDGSPRHVIHRDMSPANVLVDIDGHVRLTDFGIARMEAEEVTVVTSGMQIKGKLPYVAPELYRGAVPSVGTDVYACGVMLHELLLGKNEFRAVNALETLALASEHIATRADKARSDVSKAIADVVEKSLAKSPEKRWQSAQEFAQALREAARTDAPEMETRFREAVRADFLNPDMARFLGSPPLNEVDFAWRNATEVTGKTDAVQRPQSVARVPEGESTQPEFPLVTAPTIIDSPLAQQRTRDNSVRPPEATQRGSSNPYLIAALLASLAAAGVFAFRTPETSAPKFVYVQQEAASASDNNAEPPQQPSEKPAIRVEKPEEPAKPQARELTTVQPGLSPEQARAQRMSAAFATKRPQVEKCFARHQSDVGNRSSVQVQFAIDKRGRVSNASIVPDSLTDTAFGHCVVRAAVTTNFGSQQHSVVIRIPVTARVVP